MCVGVQFALIFTESHLNDSEQYCCHQESGDMQQCSFYACYKHNRNYACSWVFLHFRCFKGNFSREDGDISLSKLSPENSLT